MDKVIADLKESKYEVKEYSLDENSDVKAVENIPFAAITSKERLKVVGLENLKVSASLFCR